MSAVARLADPALIPLGGEMFLADRSGALWWERTATLIVSDLHLEKGSSLARRGLFVPPYDTRATLETVRLAMARFSPRRVIALGDSFHDREGPLRLTAEALSCLTDLQRKCQWLWIEGNHDGCFAGLIEGDHAARLEEAGIIFVHEAEPKAKGPEISGHFHPAARIAGAGRVVRRRCFVGDGSRLIMPALGSYTGGLNVRDAAIERLFPAGYIAHVIGDERVYPIDRTRCRED